MATKTTLKNGKVVTTTLPPTFAELDAEIRANAKANSEQNATGKTIYTLTPNERNERRLSILDLAKKAGLQTKAEYYSEDDYTALGKKAIAILERQTPASVKTNYEPTWYLPNQGYYLAKVATTIYGVKVAGLYIKSDRPAAPTIERLSIKGTGREVTFEAGKGIPYMDYQSLSPAEFEALLKNKPSWDVLRKSFSWDIGFWDAFKFDLQHPTIIY